MDTSSGQSSMSGRNGDSDTLDWSISGISAASDLIDEISNSLWTTPVKYKTNREISKEEGSFSTSFIGNKDRSKIPLVPLVESVPTVEHSKVTPFHTNSRVVSSANSGPRAFMKLNFDLEDTTASYASASVHSLLQNREDSKVNGNENRLSFESSCSTTDDFHSLQPMPREDDDEQQQQQNNQSEPNIMANKSNRLPPSSPASLLLTNDKTLTPPSRLQPTSNSQVSQSSITQLNSTITANVEPSKASRNLNPLLDTKLLKMKDIVKDLEEFKFSKSPGSTEVNVGGGQQLDTSQTKEVADEGAVGPNHGSPLLFKKYKSIDLERIEALQSEVSSIRSLNTELNMELTQAHDIIRNKDKILEDIKFKWSDLVSKWTVEQNTLSDSLNKSQKEVEYLKVQNGIAQEKIDLYAIELEKALNIASEFKTKIQEEESSREKILDNLVQERTATSTALVEEQAKTVKLLAEKNKLLVEYNGLQSQISQLRNTADVNEQERKELTAKIATLTAEKSCIETVKVQTTNELHNFYQTQMESIMAEKLEHLKVHVEKLEKDLKTENDERVATLNAEHKTQISLIKERFTGEVQKLMIEREALQSSLAAARTESSALREQLHQASKLNLAISGGSSSLTTSNPFNDQHYLSKIKNDFASLPPVLNNGKKVIKSQGASTNPSASLNNESIVTLSTREKEEIIKGFVQQFLNENPESVLDSQLMNGLNDMVNKLIDQSFRLNSTLVNNVNDASPTASSVNNNCQLKHSPPSSEKSHQATSGNHKRKDHKPWK